ncbi:MAG: SDR family oxidoreductase [Bryobacteraceae bacterium]|nr:SDR family oxidoreductase [Bryobacteraceae bacterium]
MSKTGNNRCVVTGGAGFIGSELVRGILATGEQQVTVVDNLLTGHLRNLTELGNQVDFRDVDIRDYDATLRALQGSEKVFHLAAIPSVPRSIKDPVPSHECNIDGTFNVLRAAKEAGVQRVIYAASSSAYGDTDVLPKTESMTPRPKSPYALQKLVGEYYCNLFYASFGLETVGLRFFNVYGPRQDPSSPYSGVLSIFMRSILEETAPTIHGDGNQTRDFTYVEDVVGLLLKASKAGQQALGNTYNAGNGGRFTLNEIWETLQDLTGVRIPAQYTAPREGDVRDSQADTTAAVRDLGHAPQFTLEEGLRRTFAWYQENARVEAATH